MYDSPLTLRNYCLNYVRDSVSAACSIGEDQSERSQHGQQQQATSLTDPIGVGLRSSDSSSIAANLALLNENQLAIREANDDGSYHKDDKRRKSAKSVQLSERCLICDVSEDLLTAFSEGKKLTDDVMTYMFQNSTTQLRRVCIPDASNLTTRGLRVLRGHKIRELEVVGLTKVTINELIGCLGEWSLSNLRLLNVSRSTFTSTTKFCVVVGLAKLQNLRSLDVSHTEFNHHGLEIVVEDLPFLERLDISATRVRDISPLRKCKDRIKWLSMYNLRSHNGGCEEFAPVLSELHQLVHLDISDDHDNPLDMLKPLHDCTTHILKRPHCFPNLRSLDISGKDAIDLEDLRNFILTKRENDSMAKLEFLGLMQTSACFDDMFINRSSKEYDENLTVTGSATESQILESLTRYLCRPNYVQKSLYYLYNHTLEYSGPRVDVIQMVIPAMCKHRQIIGIQMAATACLYNLTKGKNGDKIHPRWLSQVAEATLMAMETFPNHQQLQKNTLLTLCSDRILQDVTFDRFKCTKLVMDSLVTFNDTSMNRMAVAICSILAAKISTSETSSLGAKPLYMETLLGIVNSKMSTASGNQEPDIMLKFTLSALWNLTDESPSTCRMFLEKGGMTLYLQVLQVYQGNNAVETKVLGLLNNIAEVPHLRQELMNDAFLATLKSLLHSQQIDVSYFAAGIFAHLASEGREAWTSEGVPREGILEDMEMVVTGWKTPEVDMVAYRSFSPFLPLLRCDESPQVQLWAVWAIHHVCSKNPKRYCEMLLREGGDVALHHVYHMSLQTNNQELKNVSRDAIKVLQTQYPLRYTHFNFQLAN